MSQLQGVELELVSCLGGCSALSLWAASAAAKRRAHVLLRRLQRFEPVQVNTGGACRFQCTPGVWGASVRTAVRTHACISRLSGLARGNVCDALPVDAEIMRNGAGMASQMQPLCVSGVDTCKVGRRTILKPSLHRCRQILLHRVARVLDESQVASQREMVQG